ncbi:MAG: type II/IV secretion system ATPase subunit [Candidatus Altiarchaeota archaeon]|nr:type II/IV secretion system ATPase subunit [Candidatus Altiarchaeota archaeon]
MDFKVKRVGGKNVLEIDMTRAIFPPVIEESEATMEQVIFAIKKARKIDAIVLIGRRIREYDEDQTEMLVQVSNIVDKINIPEAKVRPRGCRTGGDWVEFVRALARTVIKDPIGAYVELRRERRWQNIQYERDVDNRDAKCRLHYIEVLEAFEEEFSELEIIKRTKTSLEGYKVGDRTLYRKVFRPGVRPNFTYTKLQAQYPRGEEVDSYKVGDAEVTLIKRPNSVRMFYHLLPPEFKLSEVEYGLVEKMKERLMIYKPKSEDLVEPETIREAVKNIAQDMLREREKQSHVKLDIEKLSGIITRETVGFGVLEILLRDEKVQDIAINAPLTNPIFIYHSEFEDCESNIYPTVEETQAWAARLRLLSGRPLDESNPVLDTQIEFGNIRARVAAITRSLSPFGLSFSVRRHREKPWTLPLFINAGMLTPLAAGLLSFFVDGARTMLVAGTRGAGKTSLLQSLMVEIMRRYRIITVEDTLELPVRHFMKAGYNIQSLKVQSPIIPIESELSAEAGIRTSLRLGDSALIVGEVRSKEALALYEAMRVGALANVVAGTIHGDSPYGVYDRVVNDLKVPKTSFKATDLVIIANPIKSADGLHRVRRLVSITEVRKHWENDPLIEKGFVDLMKYDAKKDILKPTSVLMDGESDIINSIASRVKDWVGDFDAVWENIELRAKTKKRLVDFANATGRKDLLEANFVMDANDVFHLLEEQVREEVGGADTKEIFSRWDKWLRSQL